MLATSQPSQPRYCLLDMPKPTVCLVLKSLSHLQRLKFTKYAKHNVKTNLIMTKFDCIQLFESCIEQQMWFLANSQWLVTKQRRRHVTDKWPRGQQVIHLNTYQHENSNSWQNLEFWTGPNLAHCSRHWSMLMYQISPRSIYSVVLGDLGQAMHVSTFAECEVVLHHWKSITMACSCFAMPCIYTSDHHIITYISAFKCFDAVGWVPGRASGL